MRLKWKLNLAGLEIVLILMQDRSTVWPEHTRGPKIILYTPDGATRLDGSCGISFWSVWRQCYCWGKIGARFAPNVPLAQKSFWTHSMVLLGDGAQLEARFSLFGDSANLDAR
jgi:hypothetical protein